MNDKREVTDLVHGTQWKNLLRWVETCFCMLLNVHNELSPAIYQTVYITAINLLVIGTY